jgi:hypothetical protein
MTLARRGIFLADQSIAEDRCVTAAKSSYLKGRAFGRAATATHSLEL